MRTMGIDFVMILCFTAIIVDYLVWLELGFAGLCYFLMWVSGVPKVYVVLFWLSLGSLGSWCILLRVSGVLKVYLAILDETTLLYIGFYSISLRRLPPDYRARALGLAALLLMVVKFFFGYVYENVFVFRISLVSGDV